MPVCMQALAQINCTVMRACETDGATWLNRKINMGWTIWVQLFYLNSGM